MMDPQAQISVERRRPEQGANPVMMWLMTSVVLFAGIVGLIGVTVWIGLLIWAAKGDGRVQQEHDRDAQHDDHL
jgi:hypothetical protein